MKINNFICFILILFILIFMIIQKANSEVISWKYNPNNYNINICLKESNNTEEICNKLVKIIEIAEKENKLIISKSLTGE